MDIRNLPTDSLIPYKRNPRDNREAVKYVANSIQQFGFKVPIVIDKNNVIVAGHTRLEAAKSLGLKEVPCVVADDLTDEQVKAFRLADNKVSEIATWDEGLLELELFDIKSLDMSDFGFELPEEVTDTKEINNKQSIFDKMELRAFEHYDYIVFVFDNQMDWLYAVNEFGLKKVDAGYGTTKKVGIGRVLHGKRLLEKIRHTGSDTESEQVGKDNNG